VTGLLDRYDTSVLEMTWRHLSDRDRLTQVLALPEQMLALRVGLLANIYSRTRGTELGDTCLAHLATNAFALHARVPGVIAAADVLQWTEQAAQRYPAKQRFRSALGDLYRQGKQWDRAFAAYRAAVAIDPADLNAIFDLGRCAQYAGDTELCRQKYEIVARSPTASPRFAARQMLARLYTGDYAAGLAALDSQLHSGLVAAIHRKPPITHPWPVWGGEVVKGRLLLDAEGWGFGDSLMFARWVPIARKRAESVALLVQPELVSLFRGQFEGVEVMASATEAGEIASWSRHYGVPCALGVRGPADVPPAPYLRAPDTFRRLPGEYRVGLVWAGSPAHSIDRFRSTTLDLWEPVLRVPGVTFYSLQVGSAASQLRETTAAVEDLGPELRDWADTAAAMKQLDLVISVDTGVAHLAGALGVPVWICLPAAAEWRWMIQGTRTHWYSSARLFRQPRVGDWSSVFAQVAAGLKQVVATR
jgi:hypothetical protein